MNTPQRSDDKFGVRRRELAEAAQETLAERGYANTSLRDIANDIDHSHGVLHYYFTDKDELIRYCVRLYKEECSHRYDAVVDTASTAQELIDRFSAVLITSLREEGPLHRLWYDLRNQAMFDEVFRTDVTDIVAILEQMLWRVVQRYGELANLTINASPTVVYAMFDGLFQWALLKQSFGEDVADQLGAAAVAALAQLTTT